MQKLTKIVATIGPSCESEEMIEKMIRAGVNVFRFNFKHNTIEWHRDIIQSVNKVAEKMGLHIGTLIDLQGPEIRINMSEDQIEVAEGELLRFGPDAEEKGFSISHPEIISHLGEGQKLLADDGTFTFHVQKKDGKVYLKSSTMGTLKNRKSLNIPGADFPFPVMVERDFEGLKLAALHEVDYVALSFVRSGEDLRIVKSEMEKYGVNAKMVAKIENKKALNNLDEIIELSDVVMVARGDLGVELPMEEVPYYQKVIIRTSLEKGRAVITATQMLQSMVQNPYPTRAEVSDVANATYDHTDAVMLSAETASGKNPLEAVGVMKKTVRFNEKKFSIDTRDKFHYPTTGVETILCDAAYNSYLLLREKKEDIAGFLVFTQSGETARVISRYRPQIPIYTFTPTKEVCESLTVNYGIQPFIEEEVRKGEVKKEDVLKAIQILLDTGEVRKGEKLIVLHGDIWAVKGGTSTVKVVTC